MKIYLAGPMSGLPESNYPAFHEVASRLRTLGHEVLNPAENAEPPCGTWQGYMRMSVAQVADCDAVAKLSGWENSRGTQVEVRLAVGMGIPVQDACDIWLPADRLAIVASEVVG
jgi:nucleoside 2-deoxyribosyltransferase